METLAPTTTVFSNVRRADITEIAAILSPRYAPSSNLIWIRAAYEQVYGSTEVTYIVSDDGPTWLRPTTLTTVERAIGAFGPPDIVTWGVWLAISKAMRDTIPTVQPFPGVHNTQSTFTPRAA